MYIGPHRSPRRQQVQQRYLLGDEIRLVNLLSEPNIPGYEGVQLFRGSREAWGYDESANLTKYGLCQIELSRQEAIARRLDAQGSIAPGELPDPWEPLRELTNSLLPHLRFHSINTKNRHQVLCEWEVHGPGTIVDFDDLSSGEKSIIQMFYPLVERRTKQLVAQIRGESAAETEGAFCLLIDEPELHLHPSLQHKLVDYLRTVTSDEQIQVIVATHSPSIVEHCSFDELFLLRPPDLVDDGSNQLVQVASDEQRLAFLRQQFGSIENLTAMLPLVVVEGIREGGSSKVIADRKLYRALHRGFDKVTMIPGGGKGECLRLLEVLNEALPEFSGQLRAVALLDRDLMQGESQNPAVTYLPVSMVENFILDPDAIWEAIQSVSEIAGFGSVDGVGEALSVVLDESEDSEVGRRVLASLGTFTFRPHRPLDSIPEQSVEFADEVRSVCTTERVADAENRVRLIIDEIREKQRRREEFHGKDVVDGFFRRYLSKAGMKKSIFTFEAARHARRRRSVNEFFDAFFDRVDSNTAN